MALAFAYACARSSRKHPLADPSYSRDAPLTTRPGPDLPVPDNNASPRSIPQGSGYTHTQGCLGSVDDKLEVDRWYAAAARACHPGSKRQGAIVSQTTNRARPLVLDIPSEVRSSCWTAFVIVDRVATPIIVDLLERNGTARRLGEVLAARSAIPQFGPFCSLRGDSYKLRLQPSDSDSTRISVAWYALD
jgi:hypothetical protein